MPRTSAMPELAEEREVELGRLVTERGRGGDHDHARIGAAGQRDEAQQDLALAELVLRTADDQEVPRPGLPGAGRGRHARAA